ncbi:MAG: DUF58 domain-containing protein [Treponema sp.]|jgi:uncharacterized protein (DUF58 family)|nr:DUF58 domain-containing protein [Treponema sp.]
MERHELLRKISTFPLVSAGLAQDILAGNFLSVFKGQGIEFNEVRHYESGDDAHAIDWNVSARFGTPFVKLYREERELSTAIVLDCSASMQSSVRASRGEDIIRPCDQGILAAALLAFSAEKAGQRVCGVFFDRTVTRLFPLHRGRGYILSIVNAAMNQCGVMPPERPAAQSGPGKKDRRKDARETETVLGSNLGAALSGLKHILRKRSLVAVISDFLCIKWEQELAELARRHDVVAIRIVSPLDNRIPGRGLLRLEDPETGLRIHVNAGSESFRQAWLRWHEERALLWESICRHAGAASVTLSTADDAASVLKHFFGGRHMRNEGGLR